MKRSIPAGYEAVAAVLDDALSQAAAGKGLDRHAAPGQPFGEQPMAAITAMVGVGFPLGQAMKKAQEAGRMAERGEAGRARSEILGAIMYLAGAALALGVAE